MKEGSLLDRLIEGKVSDEILGQRGVVGDLTRRLMERVLDGEMTAHLGYEKHAQEGRNGGNSRNGKSRKRVKTDTAELDVEVPRDRDGTFEPAIVAKGQRRLPGFDDKVIALYARGMTTREIQGHLKELYAVAVSPSLISAVTDAVLEDVKAWQARPLEAVYPIVYLDAIHVKLRKAGHVESQAVYLALAINVEGHKELLGLWIGENEGTKFWLSVLTELKNRGVQDILIAAVDGLKGFPDAIEAVFPKTQVQLCIVHLIRGSLRYVSWKERKVVVRDLKTIYQAPSLEATAEALEAFAERWDSRFPQISRMWRTHWTNLTNFTPASRYRSAFWAPIPFRAQSTITSTRLRRSWRSPEGSRPASLIAAVRSASVPNRAIPRVLAIAVRQSAATSTTPTRTMSC